jgi:hypothetical protein
MAKTQVDLDGRAYLWKETAGYAPNVVISAHGFYRPNTGQFAPGATTLRFYCAHDATVDDVPQSTRLNIAPVEIVPQGVVTTCFDYSLFKFQEHRADIRAEAKKHGMSFAEAESDLGKLGGETYATFRDVNDVNNDYVTVRNRHSAFGGKELKLSSLIGLILAQNAYAVVKCCFCREPKLQNFQP